MHDANIIQLASPGAVFTVVFVLGGGVIFIPIKKGSAVTRRYLEHYPPKWPDGLVVSLMKHRDRIRARRRMSSRSESVLCLHRLAARCRLSDARRAKRDGLLTEQHQLAR